MVKNKVRRIMYGAIVVMIALMSMKKVGQTFTSGSLIYEIEEAHTVLV